MCPFASQCSRPCVSPLQLFNAKNALQPQTMTSTTPIDLDHFKLEEDLYGDPINTKPEESDDEGCAVGSDDLKAWSKKGTKMSNSPYTRRPAHRRHPEGADTEDRVLMALVDEGWSWE